MIPRRFISAMERTLGRKLTAEEIEVVNRARAGCPTGKRDTVKAMRSALNAYWEQSSGQNAAAGLAEGSNNLPSLSEV